MKRRKWIFVVLVIVIIALLALLAHFWNNQSFQNAKVEILCEASIYAAMEHFEEYNAKQAITSKPENLSISLMYTHRIVSINV